MLNDDYITMKSDPIKDRIEYLRGKTEGLKEEIKSYEIDVMMRKADLAGSEAELCYLLSRKADDEEK